MSENEDSKVKQVQKYMCKLCGTEYSTEDSAQKCADSHKVLDTNSSTVAKKYRKNKKYPTTVTVKFTDNTTRTYYNNEE